MTGFAIEAGGVLIGVIGFYEEDTPDYRHAGMDLFLATEESGPGPGPRGAPASRTPSLRGARTPRLVIDPAASNARAIRVYEAVGFKRVGIMRLYERGLDGTFHDGLLMDLLAEDCVSGSARLGLGFEVDDDVRDREVEALACALDDSVLEPVRAPRRMGRDHDLIGREHPERILDRLDRVVVSDGAARVDSVLGEGGEDSSRRICAAVRAVSSSEVQWRIRVFRAGDDEHLRVALLRAAHDLVAEGAAGDGLVGDYQDPVPAVGVASPVPDRGLDDLRIAAE